MTEQRRKQMMYGILVVAVIWGAWNLMTPRKIILQPATPAATEMTAPVTAASAQVSFDVEAKRKEAWGRDPFSGSISRTAESRSASGQKSKTTTTKSNRQGWSLTGIIDNGTTPFAFINGKMVKVGDLIDQARVVKIEKQTVTLSINGSHVALKVTKG